MLRDTRFVKLENDIGSLLQTRHARESLSKDQVAKVVNYREVYTATRSMEERTDVLRKVLTEAKISASDDVSVRQVRSILNG